MPPSPMLRLLSPELVAISPPEDIQSETDVIDLLCYYKSLFNHFQNTNKMELADIVSLNTPNHSPFDRIDSCSENEVARMAEIGRRKYGNPTTPFSNTVTAKTPGYIASVINGFDPYFQRIVPMWTTETNINTTMFQCMHRVIYGDILQNGIDKNRCTRLVMLMTEALAIANYMHIDATPLNQRIKFWSISFLYSMYSRRWDTAPDHRAWVNASIDTSIRAHDQMRAAVFNKTNNCFRRISRWSTSLSRLRRIMTLPRSEEDERVLVNTQITTLLGLDSGGKINITPEQEAAFNTAIQNARDVIHMCETLANMAEVLLGDPVVEIVNPQEEEVPEEVAPARTQWLDQQINRMMRQAVNDIVEEYVEEGEGHAKKRNNRAKNQRRKQAARNAKAAAMEEVASTLDGMCKLVAEQTAADIIREHKRIEEEERKRIEEENRQQMEAEISRLARVRVLEDRHTLPLDFRRQLMASMLPDLESALEPTIECFVCYSDLDFTRYTDIRFLTCCEGGSFACNRCIRTHAQDFGHDAIGEQGVVRQTALIRKGFGLA